MKIQRKLITEGAVPISELQARSFSPMFSYYFLITWLFSLLYFFGAGSLHNQFVAIQRERERSVLSLASVRRSHSNNYILIEVIRAAGVIKI
jgi:hypothetical protein